jgi:hypothetical protein
LPGFSNFYANTAPDLLYEARVLKIRAEMRDILQVHDDLVEGLERLGNKENEVMR